MEEVRVVSPSGEHGAVDQADLNELLAQGFRVETPEEQKVASIEKQYGDQDLAAGAAALARGATFGLSDVALTQTGLVAPETLEGLKQANPDISLAGDVVGALGSTLVGPGALVVKGGAKAGSALAGKLLTNEAAKKIAAGAVGSAIEGAAFAATKPISEAALGDPTLTAQRAFGEISLGALLGFGVGGAISALGVARQSFLKKVAQGDDVSRGTTSATDDIATQRAEGISSQDDAFATSQTGKIDDLASSSDGVKQGDAIKRLDPDYTPTPPTVSQDDIDLAKDLSFGRKTEIDPTYVAKYRANPERIKARPSWEEAPVSVLEGLGKLQSEISELSDQAAEIVGSSGQKFHTSKMAKWIEDSLEQMSGGAYTENKAEAIAKLQKYLYGTKELPGLVTKGKGKQVYYRDLTAGELKTYLQDIRKDIQTFFAAQKGASVNADDYAVYKFSQYLDSLLKSDVEGYKDVMAQLAPKQSAYKNFLKEFRTDTSIKDSFTRTIERNLYKQAESTAEQGGRKFFKSKADAIKQFAKETGVDYFGWYDDIATRRELFPNEAKPMDWGTATNNIYRMAKGLGSAVINPIGTAADIAQEAVGAAIGSKGSAYSLGEIKRRAAEEALTGQKSWRGTASRIYNKIADATKSGTSKLFDAAEGYGSLLTPVSVRSIINDYETLDESEARLDALVSIEKASQRYESKVNATVKSLFSKELKPQEQNKVLDKFVKEKTASQRADDMDKFRNDIMQVTNDSALLIQKLTESMKGLSDYAPNIASNINMTAVRAIGLLSQKMAEIYPSSPDNLLDAKHTPTREQISSLAKTIRFINKPNEVLDDLSAKFVSNEALEVMNTVYPELFADMQAKVIDEIAKLKAQGKVIPIDKRTATAIFIGQPLDRTQEPGFILSAQNALQQQTQENQQQDQAFMGGGSKATPARADKLKMNGRLETPLQRVANR